MAKDSIEQVQPKSAENIPIEAFPPIAGDIAPAPVAEPIADIADEHLKNPKTVNTTASAKKVRKTTGASTARKPKQDGEATKTTTSRPRKKSRSTASISSKEEIVKETPITQDKEVIEQVASVQNPIEISDTGETPTAQDTQDTKDVALDETPDKVSDENPVEENLSQESAENAETTIIAEPIGEGATINVVTSDNDDLTVEQPQRQSPQSPIEDTAQDAENQRSSDRRELVRSASLVSIGNFGSSILGMVRQIFIARTGAPVSGPFFAALSPAQKFNDFIVNGSVPGALIPTFNDYAAPEKRDELRRLMFSLVNLIFLIMAGASIIFFFIAPWATTHVLATGLKPDEQALTTHYSQIIFFSLLALGPFAVLQAALFARKEFGWPAFATGAYHIGIILGSGLTAIIGTRFVGGQYGIAFGVLVGAFGEIGLLIPGLHKQQLSYMFVLDLKHPALRRILRLYAPIAFSFFVSACFALLDQSLATRTACMAVMQQKGSCGSVNWSAMQLATTLIQFPGGLVASALMFAVLPTMTTHIREGNNERFKDTLQLGFRLGLLLMIPAAAGLIVLQLPIISLLFERGPFTHQQSIVTATALQNYAYQLPFTAMDQLLIAAFYARKNTIIPVAVGAISYLGYLAVALPLWQTIGMPALPLANTTQIAVHTIILLVILRIVIGPMHLGKLVPTLVKLLLATATMVAVAWGLQVLLAPVLSLLPAFITRLITVIVVGIIAAGVYFGIVILLKVEEVTMLKGAILAKLGKK